MSQRKLLLCIGLLGFGQPVFCGPFEEQWDDPGFVRELDGHKLFAASYREQARKAYGFAPLIGSLPALQEEYVRINRAWLVQEYVKLKACAQAGKPEHVAALAQMHALVRKLDLITLRHTGILRTIGDHPRLSALVLASAALYFYVRAKKPSLAPTKPKNSSFLSRLFSA